MRKKRRNRVAAKKRDMQQKTYAYHHADSSAKYEMSDDDRRVEHDGSMIHELEGRDNEHELAANRYSRVPAEGL